MAVQLDVGSGHEAPHLPPPARRGEERTGTFFLPPRSGGRLGGGRTPTNPSVINSFEEPGVLVEVVEDLDQQVGVEERLPVLAGDGS